MTAYWALSGYGLRASRALYWLAGTMLITVVLLMGFGLPQDTPEAASDRHRAVGWRQGHLRDVDFTRLDAGAGPKAEMVA
jgi:hypothetical protein